MEKRITGFPVIDDDWKLVNLIVFCWFFVYKFALLSTVHKETLSSVL